jgi:hypothetical protein
MSVQSLGKSVGAVANGFAPVASVFGAVGNLLNLGGHSQAEIDDIRVARGNELYQCALNGDVEAAREIWYGAENTASRSKAGVANYKQLWQQLQFTRPDVYAAALAKGKTGDVSGHGCPGGATVAAAGTPQASPSLSLASMGGLPGSSGGPMTLILGAAALVAFALVMRKS